MEKILKTPLKEKLVRGLHIGDTIYLSGRIYTARDMVHLELRRQIERGTLDLDLEGSVIFHAGPICKKNEKGWELQVIGPTTSIRMEPYAKMVGELGIRVLIGKGGMEEDTLKACEEYGYIYLQAAPGCAAKLAENVKSVISVSWLEYGMPEAMWELEVESLGPFVVAMDSHGRSIYKECKQKAIQKMNELYEA